MEIRDRHLISSVISTRDFGGMLDRWGHPFINIKHQHQGQALYVSDSVFGTAVRNAGVRNGDRRRTSLFGTGTGAVYPCILMPLNPNKSINTPLRTGAGRSVAPLLRTGTVEIQDSNTGQALLRRWVPHLAEQDRHRYFVRISILGQALYFGTVFRCISGRDRRWVKR